MAAAEVYFAHPLLRARDWQDRPEFDDLCRWWGDGGRGVCALVGIGGAGKTAIAERFLRVVPGVTEVEPDLPKDDTLQTPDRLLVFSFYDAPNADHFFHQLAAWLKNEPFDESAGAPSFSQTLALLRAAPGCLLVLDGLEKVQDEGVRGGVFGQISDRRLSDLVQRLALGLVPGVAAVITTRFPIAELEEQQPNLYAAVRVDKISKRAGVALLRRRGVRGSDIELRRIVNECGRHALTIDMAGGYIAEFGDGDPKTSLRLETTDELDRKIAAEPNARRRYVLRQEYRFARIAERYREGFAKRDPAALVLLERICLFRLGVNAETLASIFTGEGKERISGTELARLSAEQLEQELSLLTGIRLLEQTTREDPSLTTQHSSTYIIHPAVRDGFLSGLDMEGARAGHDAIRKKLSVDLGALSGPREREWDASSLDLLEEVIHHTREAGYVAEAWDLFWCRANPCSFMGSCRGHDRIERICRAFLGEYTNPDEVRLSGLSPDCQSALLHTAALSLGEMGRLIEAERLLVKVRSLPVSTCAAPAIYNLASAQMNRGHLAKSRATLDAARTEIDGYDEAKEVAAIDALLAQLNWLQGRTEEALVEFRKALAVCVRVRERWDAFHHLKRVNYAQFLVALDRSKEAELQLQETLASMCSLTGCGVNEWTVFCYLMLAELQVSKNQATQAQQTLAQIQEWAEENGGQEPLCVVALLTARIKLKQRNDSTRTARGKERSERLGEAERALAEGVQIARNCGFGIYHIDLLLVRARVALCGGRADGAERDVRVALEDGIHPSADSGMPTLLAATDPECGYAWGIAEGRHLLGEALLLNAAQKLDHARFAPEQFEKLPADVRELIVQGREQLESSLDLWRKLKDPESDVTINPRGEPTERVLMHLKNGELTQYPLAACSDVTDEGVSPNQDKESFNARIGVMPSEFLTIKDIRGRVDFGIITVRPDEFRAVLERFTPHQTVKDGKRLYEYARVSTEGGSECGVAVLKTLEQGEGPAQALARDLIDELNPPWLVLVGIAGGVPDHEYTLGDVLLASRVHDFSVCAALEGKLPEFRAAGGPMHPEVERLLAHIAAFAERLGNWNTDESIGNAKPSIDQPKGVASNALYGDRGWRRKTLNSLKYHFPEDQTLRPPLYHVAATASSNSLVKDSEVVKRWLESARDIGNIEMELGGVYLAARHGGTQDYRVLAVRGISDIVGFSRSHEWTKYACNSAASFAYSLVRSGVIKATGRSPSP